MNGKSIIIATAVLVGIILPCMAISMRSLSRYENYPEIRQYINRLIEFFDIENFIVAKTKFIDLIDHGLDPDQAFNLIVSKVG